MIEFLMWLGSVAAWSAVLQHLIHKNEVQNPWRSISLFDACFYVQQLTCLLPALSVVRLDEAKTKETNGGLMIERSCFFRLHLQTQPAGRAARGQKGNGEVCFSKTNCVILSVTENRQICDPCTELSAEFSVQRTDLLKW